MGRVGRGDVAREVAEAGVLLACAAMMVSSCRAVDRFFEPDELRIRRLAAWPDCRARPLADRLVAASPPLLSALRQMRWAGVVHQPYPKDPPAWLRSEAAAAISRWPARIRARAEREVCAIVTVGALGSSGMTLPLLDEEDEPAAAIVVLDVTHAVRSPNDWAGFVAASAFKPEPGFSLAARVAADPQDRSAFLSLLLLHEVAHAFAFGGRLLPPPDVEVGHATEAYPFAKISWVAKARVGWRSAYDQQLPQRSQVQYYQLESARLAGSDMPTLYRALAHTNFPTLYAATSPEEDLADSFATFVHTAYLQQPFEIRITAPDGEQTEFRPAWGTERFAEKAMLLDSLIAGDLSWR